MKILIIDDERSIRNTMKEILEFEDNRNCQITRICYGCIIKLSVGGNRCHNSKSKQLWEREDLQLIRF